jgi:8-oxo-dGTP diphosphatase
MKAPWSRFGRTGGSWCCANRTSQQWTFPGGSVQPGENARVAACRELAEEVGLRVEPDRLTLAHASLHDWEYRRDHVRIFDLHLASEPALAIDRREIVAACFQAPEAVLRTPIPPHSRDYLESI